LAWHLNKGCAGGKTKNSKINKFNILSLSMQAEGGTFMSQKGDWLLTACHTVGGSHAQKGILDALRGDTHVIESGAAFPS
jgi:hypothetical protein